MKVFKPGQLVEMDGLLAVVVGVPQDDAAPDNHVALWFGEPPCKRISEGGAGGQHAEVWMVPAEYISCAASPAIRH